MARRAAPALAALGALALPVAAAAEVKEYQIRRMLLLKTACGVTGLEISVRDGLDRFYATCANLTHYPDGVEILCPASEDERDCRILTQKREFRHLHHLKPMTEP